MHVQESSEQQGKKGGMYRIELNSRARVDHVNERAGRHGSAGGGECRAEYISGREMAGQIKSIVLSQLSYKFSYLLATSKHLCMLHSFSEKSILLEMPRC